jgi:hypothetical protein
MWAASCDFDPRFVKPNAVRAVAMSDMHKKITI